MSQLSQQHISLGARLAEDGIPLDYGNPLAEWQAALNGAVLLDRSHEGRILLGGRDCHDLPNRMSTNDLSGLAQGTGKPTIFTNPNGRILFRALCLRRDEGLLLISEPGQGMALADYLRRNIFFGDKATATDLGAQTAQFAIHGPRADGIMSALDADLPAMPLFSSRQIHSHIGDIIVARRKSICSGHWFLVCPTRDAAAWHQRLLDIGGAQGLIPAGSLTYNCLRIRSGRAAGVELSQQYIPLEVGLWDEVSFSKGCYTGQEIIARMESRQRLAKTLTRLALSEFVPAPAAISADGKPAGALTSSAKAPDGEIYALAVIRMAFAKAGAALSVGENGVEARVLGFAGSQPDFVTRSATGS